MNTVGGQSWLSMDCIGSLGNPVALDARENADVTTTLPEGAQQRRSEVGGSLAAGKKSPLPGKTVAAGAEELRLWASVELVGDGEEHRFLRRALAYLGTVDHYSECGFSSGAGNYRCSSRRSILREDWVTLLAYICSFLIVLIARCTNLGNLRRYSQHDIPTQPQTNKASFGTGVLTGFAEYYPGLNFIHVKLRASRLAGLSWPGSARVNPAIHVDPTSFPDAPPTSRFFGPHASQQHRISSRDDAGSPLAATPAAPLPRKQKVTAPATPTSAPCAAASASAAAVDSVPAPAASEPDAAAASAPGALAAEVPADVGSFARPSSRELMAALNGRLGGCRLADLQMDGVVACAPFVHPPVIRFTSPGHMTEKLCWVEVHRRQLLNMMHGSVGAAER
nr:uncharacterized protein LOC127328792 [Lolium perenne]